MTENNDKEFDDFLNEGDKKTPISMIVIYTIREKIKYISEIYSKTLDSYIALKDEDKLKKTLSKYLEDLIKQAQQSITQLDYTIMGLEDSKEDQEPKEDL